MSDESGTRIAPGNTTDWRVHPGEILREELEKRGMSQNHLALATGYSRQYIGQVVNGKRDITAALAVRLERELDIPATLWVNLQTGYDLHAAREALHAEGQP